MVVLGRLSAIGVTERDLQADTIMLGLILISY